MTTHTDAAHATGLPEPLDPTLAEIIMLFRKRPLHEQEVFLELLRAGVELPDTPEGHAEFHRLCDEAKAKREARS
jgi:hypothetical protein